MRNLMPLPKVGDLNWGASLNTVLRRLIIATALNSFATICLVVAVIVLALR